MKPSTYTEELQQRNRRGVVSRKTVGASGASCGVGWSGEEDLNQFHLHKNSPLTLLLLNTTCSVLANSVDRDQLASEEGTDLDLHCLSLSM